MADWLNDRLQALILDAAKCKLMAGLSDQGDERKLFRNLGKQYLKMAHQVCDVIEIRQSEELSEQTDIESRS